jgi:polyisoprenoid-binding protein YceI
MAKWNIDNSHSSVTFSVRHLMISNVRGEFGKVAGSVTYDPTKPEATKVEARVEVATISTREKDRDIHLKSADFFDVEKFPTINFASKSVKTKGGGQLEIEGDLTIHGVTKPVKWTVEGPTAESADPWGNKRIGASATTKVKRSDFGMTWNKALETGGFVVGDEISVSVDVSLVAEK